MRLVSKLFSGVIVSLALAASAEADLAQVVTPDGQFTMNAAPLPGVLSGSSSVFNESDLLAIHDFVNAYDIETANKLTFLLLGTEDGLAFVNLYDQPLFGDDTSLEASLSWVSITRQGTQYQSTEAMTELSGFSIEAFSNVWEWEAPGGSDALALTNLEDGQWVSNLMAWGSSDDESNAEPMDMQFLSWTGSDLTVAQEASASSAGSYAFGYMISYLIPAPGVLSLLVIAGLTTRQRRRR